MRSLDVLCPGRYHLDMSPEALERGSRARAWVERLINNYVARGRYRLNPDPVTVEHVLVGLTNNLLHHGRAYCPCRQVTGRPGAGSA